VWTTYDCWGATCTKHYTSVDQALVTQVLPDASAVARIRSVR
jgi:hypothetical protein